MDRSRGDARGVINQIYYMKYYPVNLDIRQKKCMVTGGGGVAARKVKTLLKCGAIVTVVSPDVTKALNDLWQKGAIILKKRRFENKDLNGVFLVIAATDNNLLNSKIAATAKEQNLLCNVADSPKDSTFILPAVVDRGDLLIAVSTSGKSPALAKKLRKELENKFGEEYVVLLQLLGSIRRKLLKKSNDPKMHKKLFSTALDKGLVEMIREKERDNIDLLLEELFGSEYKLDTLI